MQKKPAASNSSIAVSRLMSIVSVYRYFMMAMNVLCEKLVIGISLLVDSSMELPNIASK